MRYSEAVIPEWIRTQIIHLHPGNTSGNQLKKHGKTNAKYVTICKLFDRNTLPDRPIATGVAACSSKDNPSRALGRQIAIGRALKELGAS